VIRASVQQKPVPAMIDDEICSVALDPVACTKLDDLSIGSPEEREQIQQDPILAVL
jgi:hypothetical protein